MPTRKSKQHKKLLSDGWTFKVKVSYGSECHHIYKNTETKEQFRIIYEHFSGFTNVYFETKGIIGIYYADVISKMMKEIWGVR